MLRGLQPVPYGKQWLRRGTPSTPALGALALGTLVLSVVSVGLPGTAMLASGWLLAAGLARRVPGLDGPVSWAAAVVIEVGLISAGSMALATVSGHEHGWRANLALLCLPGVVGLALLAWGRSGLAASPATEAAEGPEVAEPAESAEVAEPVAHDDTDDPPVRVSARPLLALSVIAAGLAVPLWIAAHGSNFRVAWVMSGDARTHALFARRLLGDGGLTVGLLKTYPALVDNLNSVLSGAGGRAGLAPGRLMLHDVASMATTYVLAGIAVSVLVVAALLEVLPYAAARARRLPAGVVVLLLLSAGVSATPLLLGTSLLDGFLSAYGAVPFVLAATVAALRCCSRPSPAAFALIGPAGVLAYLSWTPLAVVPLALVVAVSAVLLVQARQQLRGRLRSRGGLAWALAILASWGSLLGAAAITATHVATLHRQFMLPGSVTSPQPRLLYALGFLAVAVAVHRVPGVPRRQAVVALTAVVASGATVKFLLWLGPDGQTWTYYAVKSLYLLGGSLLWLLFVPPLQALAAERPGAGRLSGGLRVLQATSVGLLIFVVLGWATTLTSPLVKAGNGWIQPSAGVVDEVARIGDQGKPFILWHWSDGGNERLGNFWAAFIWGYGEHERVTVYPPTLSGGVEYWAYVEQATPHDLCLVARGVVGVDIITHDKALRASLDKTCPNSGAHVLLEP